MGMLWPSHDAVRLGMYGIAWQASWACKFTAGSC